MAGAHDDSTSSTSAPAMVRARAGSRSTMRSPTASGSGTSKRRRASSAVSSRTRARIGCSPEPTAATSRAGSRAGAPGMGCTRTSTCVGLQPLVAAHERVAAREVVVVDPDEVERDPGPGPDAFERSVGALDRAHPYRTVESHDAEGVVGRNRTADERAGHDGAGAPGREHPVDPEAGSVAVGRCAGGGEHAVEGGAHVVEPATGHRVADDDRRAVQARRRQVLDDVEARQLEEIGRRPCRPW